MAERLRTESQAPTSLTDEEIDELREMDRTAHRVPFRGGVLTIDLRAGKSETTLEECWPDPKAEVFYLFGVESQTDPETDAADVQVMMAARNALPRLLDFAERARKLLLAEEWDRDDTQCPTCKGFAPTDYNRRGSVRIGHKPGCKRAALLGLK